jgi:homoserine kinase type II
MAVYTQLTFDQIAALMAQAYDIGILVSAQGIAEGVENSNYMLTLQNAAGAQERYILTLYEKRVNVADLPFFLELMQHVAQHKVACPAPIARRDGALFGTMAGKQAALVSFLPGQSRRHWMPVHVEHVGLALAELHRATADFTGTRDNALSLAGWKTIHASITGQLDSIAPGLEKLVGDELAYLQKNWPDALQPKAVVHADLFPDNVFFEGDAVSGLIDFYFACNDALAYDVAITLNAWCFEADGTFNREKSKALLGAYQRIRPLTAEEIAAFPILLRGAAMRFLLTRAHDWLHRATDALVTPHDPLEYAAKLRFHQRVTEWSIYGIA